MNELGWASSGDVGSDDGCLAGAAFFACPSVFFAGACFLGSVFAFGAGFFFGAVCVVVVDLLAAVFAFGAFSFFLVVDFALVLLVAFCFAGAFFWLAVLLFVLGFALVFALALVLAFDFEADVTFAFFLLEDLDLAAAFDFVLALALVLALVLDAVFLVPDLVVVFDFVLGLVFAFDLVFALALVLALVFAFDLALDLAFGFGLLDAFAFALAAAFLCLVGAFDLALLDAFVFDAVFLRFAAMELSSWVNENLVKIKRRTLPEQLRFAKSVLGSSMKYAKPLERGTLIRRYKRFLADIALDDGRTVTIHCPNTGSMKHCAEPGDEVWFSTADNPERKYPHTWELTRTRRRHYIGINTNRANTLVRDAIEAGQVEELRGYREVRGEVRYGSENSRIDLLLGDHDSGAPDCFVEVKSVTLLEPPIHQGIGYFPDAVSTRGQKHLRELASMAERGHRAVLFFCVQHSGVRVVRPAAHIDIEYHRGIQEALDAGVEIIAYKARMSPRGIKLNRRIMVEPDS